MSATNTPNRQRLEVEDDDARRERLGGLLASLANVSSPSQRSDSVPSFRQTAPQPLPPSDALARAKAFLPLLQQSNAALLAAQQENPAYGNVEDTQGDDRVIQMDLGLGVYDVKGATEGVDGLGPVVDSAIPPEGGADSESEEDEEDSTLDSSDSNESSEDDSEDDSAPAT